MNIATQGWFCRKLQWFCDGSGHAVRHAPTAPEIDGAILPYAIAIVIGIALLLYDRKRGGLN